MQTPISSLNMAITKTHTLGGMKIEFVLVIGSKIRKASTSKGLQLHIIGLYVIKKFKRRLELERGGR